MAPAGQRAVIGEGVKREKIKRFGGLGTGEMGLRFGLSLNSANRRKRQMVRTVSSLHELWQCGHGPGPRAFYDYHVT